MAFCTQNVLPGIDFSNDPLLQGRNFSYLDTQLKRLGSTNFTQLPVNAPRCPVAHFQRDGHMQTSARRVAATTSRTRSPAPSAGPARTSPTATSACRARRRARPAAIRSETFADHYSQARQFWISQTGSSRTTSSRPTSSSSASARSRDPHADARQPPQRPRGPRGRRRRRARGCRCPRPDGRGADADRPARSPALSILPTGRTTFAGRKLGVLVTAGADGALVKALEGGVRRRRAPSWSTSPLPSGRSSSRAAAS